MRKAFGPMRILAFSATFILLTGAQQNIIQNGDFETPSSDGIASWNISNGDILRTRDGYSGWGLTLASTSAISPAGVSQSLNTTAQRAYQISLWAIYNPSNDSNFTEPSQRLLTLEFGVDDHWSVDAPTASWQVFTFEAHGVTIDDSISFTGYDLAGGSFIVDNVSLLDSSFIPSSPTPSPSSSSPASEAIMDKVNIIWGVVGSIIAAVASIATIYMCLDRWIHRTRYKRLKQATRV